MPELRRFRIDGIDHQRAPSDQFRRLNTTLKGMLHEARADTSPSPTGIGRKLAEEQARHRVGRLPGADRPGQDRRHDRRRGQTVVSNHPASLVGNENGRKALLLIGEGAGFQPMIERVLPTGKSGHVVKCCKRFGSR